MSTIGSVALLGAGEIGSGWAALFATRAAAVRIYDPDPGARQRVEAAVASARGIGLHVDASVIQFVADSAEAVRGAEWVQESVPEQLALKVDVLGALAAALDPKAIVASSTSACTAAELSASLPFADRFVIAHPLQPVYAVPIVELGGGRRTDRGALHRAAVLLRALGHEPVTVRGDPRGLVSNRLTVALLREAVELVASGVVSARELDQIVARGVATGWVTAGVFGTEQASGDASKGQDTAERTRAQLGPVLPTLARWSSLSGAHLTALAGAMDARRGEAPRQEEWAARLARLLAAARER